MKTCSVNAKNDNFEIHFEVESESSPEIMSALMDSFRDVIITDTSTGEVVFEWYVHSEFFIPKRTLLETIALILKD